MSAWCDRSLLFPVSLYLLFPTSHLFRNDPIPDPIKLLRRLGALESRIEQLKIDCVGVAEGKRTMALAVTDLQLKNAHILRKVSAMKSLVTVFDRLLSKLLTFTRRQTDFGRDAQ